MHMNWLFDAYDDMVLVHNITFYNEYIDSYISCFGVTYLAYLYARRAGKLRYGEDLIKSDALQSYFYARDVIEGRFELGEPVILEGMEWIYEGYLRHLRRCGMNEVIEELEVKKSCL